MIDAIKYTENVKQAEILRNWKKHQAQMQWVAGVQQYSGVFAAHICCERKTLWCNMQPVMTLFYAQRTHKLLLLPHNNSVFVGLLPRSLEIVCIDPHQTGFVGKGSDHLQLIKFWPSSTPGKGICRGWNFLPMPYYSQ